jgi:hypothetical protein
MTDRNRLSEAEGIMNSILNDEQYACDVDENVSSMLKIAGQNHSSGCLLRIAGVNKAYQQQDALRVFYDKTEKRGQGYSTLLTKIRKQIADKKLLQDSAYPQ